jgi:hypothetical protein
MKKALFLLTFTLLLSGCMSSNTDIKADTLAVTVDEAGRKAPGLINADLPVRKLVITTSANNRHEFEVELATTDQQRKVGLMNRKSLEDNKGMLFAFANKGFINFWMKNTLIPLDIIFMDEKGYIKHIARNAQPCKALRDADCPLYNSQFQVQYVLEVKGGKTDQLGIKEGDRATWLN